MKTVLFGLIIVDAVGSVLGIAAPAAHAQPKVPPAAKAVSGNEGFASGMRVTFPVGHTAPVYNAAISPDKRLAVTSDRKTLIFWECDTGNELVHLPYEGIFYLAFSPDGKRLVLGSEASVTVLEVATRKKLWEAKTESELRSVTFSPDGSQIAAGTDLQAKRGGVYVWNAATGGKSFELNVGDRETVSTVEWTTNGAQIIAGCSGGDVVLCDARTGKVVRTLFNVGTDYVDDLDIHPNGHQVLVGTHDKDKVGKKISPVRVWEIETGKPVQDFAVTAPASDNYPRSVHWAEAGKTVLATFLSQPAHVWDANGTLRKTYPFPQRFSKGSGISRDGAEALFPVGITTTLLRLADGKEQKLAGRKLPITGVAFSENGKWGLVGADNGEVRLFEAETGRFVRRYMDLAESQPISTVGLSANGERAYAVTAQESGKRNFVVVWETATGKTLLRQQTPDSGDYKITNWNYTHAALSGDGKTFFAARERGQLRGWSVDTGRELFSPLEFGISRSIQAISFRPDNQAAAVAFGIFGGDKGFLVLNAQTGLTVKTLPTPQDVGVVRGFLDWSVDGKYLVYAKKPQQYYLFDVEAESLLGWYKEEEGDTVQLTPGGIASGGGVRGFVPGASVANSFRVPGTPNASVRTGWWPRSAFVGSNRVLRNLPSAFGGIEFFDLTQNKTALMLLPLAGGDTNPGGEWLAYDSSGRFTGSEGAMQAVFVVIGGASTQQETTLPIARFFERYYTPSLFAAVLGQGTFNPSVVVPLPPSPEETLKNGAPPQVRLVVPASVGASTVEVTVEATEQAKGGVKAVRLYQNGRLVGGPSVLRGIGIEAVGGTTTTKKFTVSLESGANEFRTVAYSNTDVESRPASATVTFALASVAKPTLHVLAVGINTYKDAGMNLAYARPDAEALADLFDAGKSATGGGKAGGTGLFAQTNVARLFDQNATGSAILAGIANLAKTAKPEDVVMVYLAGHGEMAGDMWYFLPSEMRQMALTERVQEFGIPWSKIDAAVKTIRARKVLLVVDACKSGGALVSGGVRGAAVEQQALAVMARAQGIHILTASTSQQYAGEVKALGHGILTYALLEGLNGKAGGGTGSPASTAVMVRELMTYVENRVPELSLKYRGEAQYPVPFGRGQNFPVATRQ